MIVTISSCNKEKIELNEEVLMLNITITDFTSGALEDGVSWSDELNESIDFVYITNEVPVDDIYERTIVEGYSKESNVLQFYYNSCGQIKSIRFDSVWVTKKGTFTGF